MRSNAANFGRSCFGWLGLDRDSIPHSAFYLLLRNSIITSHAAVLRNLNRYQPVQLCDLCAS